MGYWLRALAAHEVPGLQETAQPLPVAGRLRQDHQVGSLEPGERLQEDVPLEGPAGEEGG